MKAFIILLCSISIFAASSFAGDGTWVKKTPVTSLFTGQYSLFEPQRLSGEDTRSFSKMRGFVRLNYTRKLQSDRTHNYDWNMTVNFNYLVSGVSTAGSLTIKNEVSGRIYDDYLEVPLPDATLGYTITITSVTGNYMPLGGGTNTVVSAPQTSTFIPDDIDLVMELRPERVYNLSTANVLDDVSRIDFVPADYKLYWDYQQGAEEYDLEWVFIDKYSPEYVQVITAEPSSPTELVGYKLPFELLEPTRVRVWGNSYQIDKTFPEGRLYFRVRPVSTFADQTTGISDDIRSGKWGYLIHSGTLTLTKYEVTNTLEFEPTKTWLYAASYADDGKSVNTLTYYDGSNRGRQNLTYNTSDNVTLVGESKYDKEGRQTVSVIPAPVVGRNLLYQTNFNLAASGNVFDEGEIEQSTIPALLTTSGSAKYFSVNNDFTSDLFREAIPNANGYVFSQTIFRNDGTGRIERVGGIGSDFQASGVHAARTWYGGTNVAELKRLFGDNVSDAPQGYRKDMVQDANGQLSVTYYDKRGNTIATALSGESPTSLRKLVYAEETIGTPLNQNNVQIGNSLISEYTHMNTIPGSTITLDYSLTSFAQIIAAQTITVEGYEIPFEQFCPDCIYNLRIEVIDQYGSTVGTPVQQHIQPAACQPATYTNNGYTVTLPNIGEYRIIKTLTVDEASMIAAFQAQLDAQGTSSFDTFLSQYLENVDITACITDCEDYCYYKVRQEYLQTHTLAQWDTLTKSEIEYLVTACTGIECDLDQLTADDPIAVDPVQGCETQRQRMLHQFSPGGVYYENSGSYLWTAIGSSYGGYTLAQYQDEANFTDAMAVALLPIHRENCMLQSGRCETWMSIQNASFDITNTIMNTPWPSSATGVFATPYSSTYDPAYNAFGINTALQTAVINYATNNNITIPTDVCAGTGASSLTSGNLYAYANFYGDYVVALQQCSGISYTSDEIEQLKKQLFLGLYLKIKWDLVRTNCGCTLYDDQNAIFLIPQNYATMDAIIDGALSTIANAVDCEEVAINNVNHWMASLPTACITALGMSSFVPVVYQTTPGSPAAIMQNNYMTSAPSPNIAQLFYNYTMATCDVATNPNTFGSFYDPGTGNPGKTQYDAIRTALAVSGCDYTTGTMLPFQTTAPSGAAIAFSNYNPADLKAAIENLTYQILACTSCTETTRDEYQTGVIKYMRVKQMTGVTAGMPSGYSGTVRMVKTWLANSSGVVNTAEGYRYYFDMTITNGNCTFTLPLNTQSPLGNDGNWVFGGNFYFRTNTPVLAPDITFIGAIVHDYLNISVNSTNLVMNWDCLVGTFNGNNVQYLNTAILADCAGSGTINFNLGSAYGDLQNLEFNQTNDCIQSQIEQATADAQVMYNQIIENLWSEFYEKMKSCLIVREDFRMTYKLKEYQYTLYYYDLAGNLVQTVPPQGVHPFNQTQIDNCLLPNNTPSFPAHDMETRYLYNGLNALISSYTPDGGKTTLYLDKLYRVRFSQNAQQKVVTEGKASYSKYDELGRVIEAGEFKIPASDNIGLKMDDQTYPLDGILDYTHTFYEGAYVPPSTTTTYPYPSTYISDPTLNACFGTTGQQNLRNSIGAVMHRQADYDPTTGAVVYGTEVITVLSYSYDAHKNVKRAVTTNNSLAVISQQHKITDYKYDLISGSVEEVIYQDNNWDEYHHKYQYDANNRLVRAYTSHNGDFWELDAKYFYYLHGSLARRELGHDQIQGTDYAYNLQGWLKGVNSSTLDRTRDIGKDGNTGTDNQFFGTDAFGFALSYFTNDYEAIKDAAESPQVTTNDYFAGNNTVTALNVNADAGGGAMASLYNGNITNMTTALLNEQEAKLDILSNNYQYDQLQRIREMKVYYASTIQTNNNFTGAVLYNGSGGESAYQENYTFDKNGNLLTLKRNGSGRDAANNTAALGMDNMTYSYYTQTGTATTPTNMNSLEKVSDAVTVDGYAGDIVTGQASLNYRYNKNGQLTQDNQENIYAIGWSVTGKVKTIDFTTASGKHDVKFIYDPMDRRIAKLEYLVEDRSSAKWTYYSYDAGGNILATYSRNRAFTSTDATYNNYSESYSLNDHMIYGGERLGLENEQVPMKNQNYRQVKSLSKDVEKAPSWQAISGGFVLFAPDYTQRVVADKRYEMSNHLGNVLAVVNDRKVSGVAEVIYKNTFDVSSQALSDSYAISGTGSITFSNQRFVATNVTNNSGAVRTITPTVAGRSYMVKFTLDLNASGNVTAFVKDVATTNTLVSVTASSTGEYTLSFVATGTSIQLGWINVSGATRSFYLDNVIVWDRSVNNTQYAPDVVSYSDYSPYGTLLDNRHGNDNTYRYGFQGQERDDEVKGAGNSYNYEYRMHDPRIGRFFARDPLAPKYPYYTPYQFSGNRPIDCVEREGLEPQKDGTKPNQKQVAVNIMTGRYYEYTWKKFTSNGYIWEQGDKEVEDPALANKIMHDPSPVKALQNSLQKNDGGKTKYVPSEKAIVKGIEKPSTAKGNHELETVLATANVAITTIGLDLEAINTLGGLDEAQKMIQSGNFQVIYNGELKTWSMRFPGNKNVAASLVKEAKLAYSQFATEGVTALKVVKGSGLLLNFAGLALTGYEIHKSYTETGEISVENGLDVVFGVIGFFGMPGAITAASYSFVAKPLADRKSVV